MLGNLLYEIRETNDINSELKAYDNIGMEYYYMGDIDKAKYYNTRMMGSNRESAKSELRQYRHKFVFKFSKQASSIDAKSYREILKREYQKCYGTEKNENYFSNSTQRFFTRINQKVISKTASMPKDNMPFIPKSAKNGLISISPNDLSLLDLPSLHVPILTEEEKRKKIKEKRFLLKCPIILKSFKKKLVLFYVKQ